MRLRSSVVVLAALDELVAANPKRGGPKPRRGGGPRRSGGSAGVHAKAAALGKATLGRAPTGPASNRNRGPIVIPGRAPGGGPLNSKIIVSNLPVDVTEAQVKVSTAAILSSVHVFTS